MFSHVGEESMFSDGNIDITSSQQLNVQYVIILHSWIKPDTAC